MDHGGHIFGLYPGSTEFEHIADITGDFPNMTVNRDGSTLYIVNSDNRNITRVNVATGAISSFGSVPSTGGGYGHFYGNRNARDTLGYAYYVYTGTPRILRVYLGKNELGPYKKFEASALEKHASGAREKGLEVKVYPNPFTTSVDIKIVRSSLCVVRSENADIEIFDIRGRLISNIPRTTNYVWHAQDQPPGVYLVKVKLNNRTLTKKMLIQR
jgi:hypothetical protein